MIYNGAYVFENENYVLTYKGHLENKISLKSICVWGYLSTKYMGKTTDTFGRLKFRLPANLSRFMPKFMLQFFNRATKIRVIHVR